MTSETLRNDELRQVVAARWAASAEAWMRARSPSVVLAGKETARVWGSVSAALDERAELLAALQSLLSDVESSIDYGMPFENPEHGFHESVMAARAAIAKANGEG